MGSTWKDKMNYLKENNNDCDLCRELDGDDYLYAREDWDAGVGFREIRHIKYCPLCGKKLFIWED